MAGETPFIKIAKLPPKLKTIRREFSTCRLKGYCCRKVYAESKEDVTEDPWLELEYISNVTLSPDLIGTKGLCAARLRCFASLKHDSQQAHWPIVW